MQINKTQLIMKTYEIKRTVINVSEIPAIHRKLELIKELPMFAYQEVNLTLPLESGFEIWLYENVPNATRKNSFLIYKDTL